jgi:hypothetical protein
MHNMQNMNFFFANSACWHFAYCQHAEHAGYAEYAEYYASIYKIICKIRLQVVYDVHLCILCIFVICRTFRTRWISNHMKSRFEKYAKCDISIAYLNIILHIFQIPDEFQ